MKQGTRQKVKITGQSNEDIYEKDRCNAKTSMRLSGFTLVEEHIELVQGNLKGEIPEKGFKKIALEKAKKK